MYTFHLLKQGRSIRRFPAAVNSSSSTKVPFRTKNFKFSEKTPKKVFDQKYLLEKEAYLKNLFGKQRRGMTELAVEGEFSNLNLETTDDERKGDEGQNTAQHKEAIQNEENLTLWEKVLKETEGKKVDFPHFKAFRNRPLTDATAVFHHNAW